MDVNKYFARIGLPLAPSLPKTLTTLHAIQRKVLHSLPFENLDVRSGVRINPKLEDAYVKIVERGRGGFCYEMNCLLHWALKSIGFDAELHFGNGYSEDNTTMPLPENMPETYVSKGYVRGAPGWNWQTHVVIVVKLLEKDCGSDSEFILPQSPVTNGSLDGKRSYFVDVGYGEPPQAALWMVHGIEQLVVKTGDRYTLFFEEGQWFQARWDGSKWVRRMKWSTRSRSYSEIAQGLDWVQTPYVWFAYKSIVTLLSDKIKTTLSNMDFIQTILPNSKPIRITLDSKEKYYELLNNVYGVKLSPEQEQALNLK